MKLLFKLVMYFPRLMVDQILYVHSKDPELTELQNDIAWGISVAVVIFVALAVLSIA